MQGVKFNPKEDKVKHGLMIKPKYLILGGKSKGFPVGRRRKREEKKRTKKGKRKKRRRRKFRFGIHVWNFHIC